MRDDLNRPAQVIAAALLTDDRIVHLAGGEVGFARQLGGGETLVMAQVEVGFRSVIGDEHLSVLEGAHGPGVDVDIRVHLLHRDPQAPRLHESANGSGGQPLAEGRYNATGDEQKLGLH